jgi:hypothetical protein
MSDKDRDLLCQAKKLPKRQWYEVYTALLDQAETAETRHKLETIALTKRLMEERREYGYY